MQNTLLPTAELERLLAEDAPFGDLTTDALGIGEAPGSIGFAARQRMVVAAIEDAAALLELAGVEVALRARSGDEVEAGTLLLQGRGEARALHRGWKVAQTLLEIWSGIATATRALVLAARAARPDIAIACTRKNVPGTKALAIAAVKAGGAAMTVLGFVHPPVFPEHRAFLHGCHFARLAASSPRQGAGEKARHRGRRPPPRPVRQAVAGFDVIQAEKLSPHRTAQLAESAVQHEAAPPPAALPPASHSKNAPAYVKAEADILVSSFPYTARPAGVAVTIAASR